MAISRLKNWVAEVLKYADLNAEFNNIINNATSLISPLTANLAAGGFKVTGLGGATSNGESVRYEQVIGVLNAPTGTRTLFHQTTAPTGWTKDTTAGLHDNALRLTTGTVTPGGAVAFSTVHSATRATTATAPGDTDSFTLTIAEMPAHTHSASAASNYQVGGGSDRPGSGGAFTGGSTGGGGGHSHAHATTHTHTSNLNVLYQDVIVASKD